jgi:predicted ArsR family transcriptional regulator
LTREQIRTLFHGHVSSDRIDAALEQLTSLGLVTKHSSPGRGRPSTLWSAMEDSESAMEDTDVS